LHPIGRAGRQRIAATPPIHIITIPWALRQIGDWYVRISATI
jgi:hypothetical protein